MVLGHTVKGPGWMGVYFRRGCLWAHFLKVAYFIEMPASGCLSGRIQVEIGKNFLATGGLINGDGNREMV